MAGLAASGQELLASLSRDDPDDVLPGTIWGGTYDWNDKTKQAAMYVGRVVLHFAGTDVGSNVDTAQDLYGGIDAWFERVATWVRVLVDQDVDSTVSGGSVSVLGRGLDVRTVSGDAVGPPSKSEQRMRVRFPANQQPIDVRCWQYTLTMVDGGEQPPIEHLLAADARTALRLGSFRRAVIDAATSVDLALNRILDAGLAALGEPMRSAVRSERRMLGPLTGLLSRASSLPPGLTGSDIESKVARVRNQTMHAGYSPTRDEADEAVRLALKIAKEAVPLPHGGP